MNYKQADKDDEQDAALAFGIVVQRILHHEASELVSGLLHICGETRDTGLKDSDNEIHPFTRVIGDGPNICRISGIKCTYFFRELVREIAGGWLRQGKILVWAASQKALADYQLACALPKLSPVLLWIYFLPIFGTPRTFSGWSPTYPVAHICLPSANVGLFCPYHIQP